MPIPMHSAETTSRRFWVMMILGLMAINLGVAIIAVVMAIGDASLRPMPDYGEQAVSWQVRKEKLEQSKALGWQWTIARDPHAPPAMLISMVDRDGKPVENCQGELQAYHFTTAGQVLQHRLTEVGPGQYRVECTLRKSGLWRLCLDLEQPSGDRFVVDEVWCLDESDQFEREPDAR